jgi:hypothetical protein
MSPIACEMGPAACAVSSIAAVIEVTVLLVHHVVGARS